MTEDTQKLENRILERLNKKKSVRGFLLTVIGLLSESVDILVLQVFRKDDYAVKYAVEPLLGGTGPLAELPIRLKLIYALGVISRNEYEDIERLMLLNERLSHSSYEYTFTSEEVLGSLRQLHGIAALPAAPAFSDEVGADDQLLIDMQQRRYQQMVHSSLVLYITELVSQLSVKKAF
ncbi:MltR family transcriptional regulator [Budvicia diplopodorum]|uniref:MltR family transcriptional regulator n=1 Tax=Budvicia diplopodorum TaxID=1119056 RepID=UPI00135ADB89|nr:MltR family transcriptional regulator [Budvicia diplopodorum]